MENESVDQIMRRIIDDTRNLRDDTGRDASDVFQVLPDRKLTDYYRVIKNPISLTKISRRITHKRYKRFYEFIKDVAQIVFNAKTYNEKNSMIYNHADILERYIRDELSKLRERGAMSEKELRYPNLGALPDGEDEDEDDDDTLMKSEDDSIINNNQDDDENDDYYYENRRSSRPKRQVTLKKHLQQEEEDDDNNDIHGLEDKRKKRGRPPTVDRPHEHRIKAIMRGVRKEKESGRSLYVEFEKLPDPKLFVDYYSQITDPIALDSIRKKIKRRQYKSVEEFLNDMNQMFNNAKSYNQDGSMIYQDAERLQYVMLSIAEEEMKKPDSAYQDPESNSKTARIPLDNVEHRGEIYRVGDWVHINNNNDPSKPTIGQIFRIWKTANEQSFINVCWYYRPEQTVHKYEKLFYENEVVKSGQYRDHLVDEILEKCFVMFVTKYQRGRPAGIGNRSVYCCESRYNENEKTFNKIRTWKACIPDEVRSADYPMDMFERTHMLRRVISPIKHLLPIDAREDDPIPEPKLGAPNAPPIVGAVYKRPFDPKDPPEQPTDETADVGTPKQATSRKQQQNQLHHSGSNSQQTRQYNRQPQPFLPPGGVAPIVKTTANNNNNTPVQNAVATPSSAAAAPAVAAAATPTAVSTSYSNTPALNTPGGFYQPQYFQQHSNFIQQQYSQHVNQHTSHHRSGYIPPAPNAVFTLPKSTQDLLPERDLKQDKIVKTNNGDMAWFSAPPIYINRRIINLDTDYLSVRIKRPNEDGGDDEDEEDVDQEEDVYKMRRAPLGQSAKYLLWKRQKLV